MTATHFSYSAAKKHIGTLTDQIESLTIGGEDLEAQEGPLAFFDHEINDQNHDDALVISIYLVNCEVKRVLIDPGSSVNIIYLNTVKIGRAHV